MREIQLCRPRVIVALGGFAWTAVLRDLPVAGMAVPAPRPKFGHGVEAQLAGAGDDGLWLLGCYHPSQQNTFTGRLTPDMLDGVLGRARDLAGARR